MPCFVIKSLKLNPSSVICFSSNSRPLIIFSSRSCNLKKRLILFFALMANAADKFDCSKRYCKEMKSCEEAYHYLRKCGRSGFDRDRDGIPCENVCKERRVEK